MSAVLLPPRITPGYEANTSALSSPGTRPGAFPSSSSGLEEGPSASTIRYAAALQVKKGEDYWVAELDVERVSGRRLAVFGIFDGHNGAEAAAYCKEHLVKHVLAAVPEALSEVELCAALPRAMVVGFLRAEAEILANKELRSGTTATLVIVDGWTVTVAAVGDSRCVLDTPGNKVTALTVDHRLDWNEEECQRITDNGGQVARLRTADGDELGPLRVWPGGLCLSRTIGDPDVGPLVVPVPHVKQIKLPQSGGRLIIASDGVWDALENKKVAKTTRGLPPEKAASQVVKEAIKARGLRDDTTVLVVDIFSSEHADNLAHTPVPKVKSSKSFSSLFSRKKKDISVVVNPVEEIFEASSAELAERLGTPKEEKSVHAGGPILCAVCRTNLTPDGVSVYAGMLFAAGPFQWEGPFLCVKCRAAGSPKTS